MRLCSYVVMYDHGFAPNPYWGPLTVACCKPVIRKGAQEGDLVVGTSSQTRGHCTGTRLVYAMKVSHVLTFDEYSQDPTYSSKIPHQGLIEQRGDNMYFRADHGAWRQRVPSYHSKGWSRRIPMGRCDYRWELSPPWEEDEERKDSDLRGDHVLVSDPGDFWYYGGGAIELPESLRWVIYPHKGQRCNFSIDQITKFSDWITRMAPGKHGDPIDLNRRPIIPPEAWPAQSS